MSKFVIIIICFCVLFSCKPPNNKTENYNFQLLKLIFSNQTIKSNFDTIFDRPGYKNTVFKLLASRRDKFVRITIYRLINKGEVSEYPSSYFVYDSKTFLCYDGSEVVYNKRLDINFINKLKERMKSGYINDSRVFQFDIDYDKKIKLNIPAINPYDFDFKPNKLDKVLFPPRCP